MEAPVKVVCLCGQETYNREGWCGRCLPMHPPRRQPELVPVAEFTSGADCWSCGRPGRKHSSMEGRYDCAPCEATWNTRPTARPRPRTETSIILNGVWVPLVYLDHGDGHYPSPA